MRLASLLRKLFLWGAAGLASLALVAAGAWLLVFPRAADPDPDPYPATAERLDRGRYLVENVATSLDCHSRREWSIFSGPPIPETRGGPTSFPALRRWRWSTSEAASEEPAGRHERKRTTVRQATIGLAAEAGSRKALRRNMIGTRIPLTPGRRPCIRDASFLG
jgi:hypothetical protein